MAEKGGKIVDLNITKDEGKHLTSGLQKMNYQITTNKDLVLSNVQIKLETTN